MSSSMRTRDARIPPGCSSVLTGLRATLERYFMSPTLPTDTSKVAIRLASSIPRPSARQPRSGAQPLPLSARRARSTTVSIGRRRSPRMTTTAAWVTVFGTCDPVEMCGPFRVYIGPVPERPRSVQRALLGQLTSVNRREPSTSGPRFHSCDPNK